MTHLNDETAFDFRSFKDRLIGSLIPGLCHEINNPLNNIVLTLDVLIEEESHLSPDEKLEMIREALKEAERTREMVKDLQELARGCLQGENKFSIEALVDQTLRLLKNEGKVRRVKIEKQVEGPLPRGKGNGYGFLLALIFLVQAALRTLRRGGRLFLHLKKKGKEVAIEITWPAEGVLDDEGEIRSTVFDGPGENVLNGKGYVMDLLQDLGGRIEVEEGPTKRRIFLFFPPSE